jgi:hypothetical protein
MDEQIINRNARYSRQDGPEDGADSLRRVVFITECCMVLNPFSERLASSISRELKVDELPSLENDLEFSSIVDQ